MWWVGSGVWGDKGTRGQGDKGTRGAESQCAARHIAIGVGCGRWKRGRLARMEQRDLGSDVGRIREALAENPRAMTVQVARELGVAEAEVIRAMPEGRGTELDAGRWEQIVRALEGLGDVHVIVSNGGVTLEAFGRFGNFSSFGEGERRYFNVQTKSLDLHIRPAAIGAVFAVRKPGHLDGVETLSVQFYHREGFAAFKVFLTFGGRGAAGEKVLQFVAMCERFARRGAGGGPASGEKSGGGAAAAGWGGVAQREGAGGNED